MYLIICGPLVLADADTPTWHQTATMSDPRLEGDHYHSRLTNTYVGRGPDEPQASTVSWATQRIENEGGAWQGTMVTLDRARRTPEHLVRGTGDLRAPGEGGYEGLTAIYDVVFNAAYGCGVDVWGVIFEGGLPLIEPSIPEQ